MKRLTLAIASALGLVCGTGAMAQNEVRIDINELIVDAGGAFGGENHTGPLVLASHSLTRFVSIRTASGNHTPPPFGLSGLNGQITLDAGMVVGADLLVVANDGSSFSTSLGGPGAAVARLSGGFVIDGLMSSGRFSGPTFAGVDVSAWPGNQLQGHFLLSNFDPDPNGFSSVANIELVITAVPGPGSALLMGIGAIAFGTRRRR